MYYSVFWVRKILNTPAYADFIIFFANVAAYVFLTLTNRAFPILFILFL